MDSSHGQVAPLAPAIGAGERPSARPWLAMLLLAFVLAFGFLGARGIWDPDEGRYTNVALNMLHSGDWVDPMRSEHTGHWTKPPLTYWLVAGSVSAFGYSPWAARLPIALAYLACIGLAWRTARRLTPGSERQAPIVYATLLLPFLVGEFVSTDFPLAAVQGSAVAAFVEYRFGPGRGRHAWLLLMWAAFGLAFLVKGPPALVPLLPILLLGWLVPRPASVGRAWHLAGVLLCLAVALPWFAYVSMHHPGLVRYFLGVELVDRVATGRFGHNAEWYGWLKVYVPTLVLGTLPWTRDLWQWLASSAQRWRGGLGASRRQLDAAELFLALWIVVPVLVFCLARSRLPTYLLPTFLPLAVAIAAWRHRQARRLPARPWLAAWVMLLLGLRLAAAHYPTHKDAAAWAEAIRERAPGPVREVVFVEDMARYGLHLHLDAEVEKVSLRAVAQPRFNPAFDEPIVGELEESDLDTSIIFVTRESRWPEVRARVAELGYAAQPLGDTYQGRVIFDVVLAPAAPH